MTVKMINRTVGDIYVVSVEERRVRILEDTPSEPIEYDGFFLPGLLLSVEDSRSLLKTVGETR